MEMLAESLRPPVLGGGSCGSTIRIWKRDLRELAESDAEAERWTTGKALWKMFENWCIDDDEEGDES